MRCSILCFVIRCVIALCLLSITNISTFAQSPTDLANKIFDQHRRSIVKIWVKGHYPDGSIHNREGTGFFISSDTRRSYLLTARHLIGSNLPDQTKNPDWLVQVGGKIDRHISIGVFDEQGNLVVHNAKVDVEPIGNQELDIACLEIDEGPFPKLALGSPQSGISHLYDVMLLAFADTDMQLTAPIPVGRGQLQGTTFLTTEPSREGESGGPWIELSTGKVLAIASLVRVSKNSVSHEAAVITPIQAALGFIIGTTTPSENAAPKVLEQKEARQSPRQDLAINGSSSDLDLIYFKRQSDGNLVDNVLKDTNTKFRYQAAESWERSNVVTCASNRGLKAAKRLASALIEAGVPIQGIAPQISPKANKVTIEFYQSYSKQPFLSTQRISDISSCPSWEDAVSDSITVKNNCNNRDIKILVRYFHPTKEKWVTAVKDSLGPGKTWAVEDETGEKVGSGKSYILDRGIAINADTNSDESSTTDTPQSLENLPDQSFVTAKPNTAFGCPRKIAPDE